MTESKDFHTNYAIKDINKNIQVLVDRILELEDKLSSVAGYKNMKVDNANVIKKFQGVNHWKNKNSNGNLRYYGENTVEETVKYATEHLEALWAEAQEIHESNKEALENNQKLYDSIVTTMESIGIQRSYTTYEYPSKRSRKMKQVTKYAEYPSELKKYIALTDAFYSAEVLYKSHKNAIEEFQKKHLEEQEKAIKEKVAKEKQEKELRLRVAYAVKYEIDLDSSWSDILETILDKNKYLKLGYYLYMNRSDWNDGDWYARKGLDSFEIVIERDHEIYDDIAQYTGEKWDGDGRIFRDCRWNYDELYNLVEDEQLVKDYVEVSQYENDNF